MFLTEEYSNLLHKLTNLEEKIHECIFDDTKNNIVDEIEIIKSEINTILSLLSRCGK